MTPARAARIRRAVAAGALALVCSLTSAAHAQSSPSLAAHRTQHPPEIDGVLEEDEWRDAAVSDVFTQKSPLSGQAPSERTVMRILYDDDSLYVAFECEQRRSRIVEVLARRDRPTETDSVSIAVDSRATGRSAFEFSVSVAGVLVDGMRFDDGHIAREWDEIWEGRAATHAGGWSAELRIPLHLLRFEPAENQVWGLQARRYVSAKQELDEWSYIPPAAGGEVSHYGRLTALRGLRSNASFELQPFVLGRARYREPNSAVVDQGWSLAPSAGLDFKWHPGGGAVLIGTINPDFGQVEADQLILNLSTTELAFPEKRPFFLADMDEFSTPTPIFYSRRIGRTLKSPAVSAAPQSGERLEDFAQPAPLYTALKLAIDSNTGWSMAALSAVTGPNQVDVVLPTGASEQRLIDPLTSFNALRGRVQLAPHLGLGVLGTATMRGEPFSSWAPESLTSGTEYPVVPATDGTAPKLQRCPQGELVAIGERCFHDAYVGSTDLVWTSPSGEYALRAQLYSSLILNGPPRRLVDGLKILSGDSGSGGTLRLSKQGGEHWLLDGTLTAHSYLLDFNDLGLMDRQNTVRGGLYAEYRTLDPWLSLRETHTSALAYGENNLDGLQLARGVMLMEHLVFDGWWTLTLGGYGHARHFDDREIGDGTALERAALFGAFEAISTDTRRPLVVSAQLDEEWLASGANLSAQVAMTWHPTSSTELQLVPSYTYNYGEPRYAGAGDQPGDLIFGRLQAISTALTVRASCTFVPTLTLQTFASAFLASGEYFDYTHAPTPTGDLPMVWLDELEGSDAPAIRPDFESASLAINVVLRWEYHLGSALYLLYARSQSPNVTLAPNQSPSLDVASIGAAPATDLIMLKLTYWIG